MPTLQTKYQQEDCPRCGELFVCKANNISDCDCIKMPITEDEQKFIGSKFSNCLCNKCLKEMKFKYYLAYHHNIPFNYDPEK